jgi:hypothetical protein
MTLRRLIKSGKFPAVLTPSMGRRRVGRILVLEDDVDEALKRWRTAGATKKTA